MAIGVKPLSGGIQNSLLKRLEWLINEFPGFPTLFFGLPFLTPVRDTCKNAHSGLKALV